MKEKIRDFIMQNYKIMVIILIFSGALGVLGIPHFGIKDSITFFMATSILIFCIYLLFTNRKQSMFLFLLGLPILVTARKMCNYDLFFLRITYETIYVFILFVFSFKDVIKDIRKAFKEKKRARIQFLILTATFLIFVLNSCIYSVDLLKSLTEIHIGVVTPILFMLCFFVYFSKEDSKAVLYAFIIGIDCSCFYGITQMFSRGLSIEAAKASRDFISFGYHNVNVFGGIFITVVPFLLEMIFYGENTRKEKIFLWGSLLLNSGAIYITYTRGAWICFMLAAFILLIDKKYKKLMIVVVILSLIVAKPVFSYVINRGNNSTFLQNESNIARMQGICVDYSIMKNYPFGVGAGNFPIYYKKFSEAGYLMLPEKIRWVVQAAHYPLEHAHNVFLNIGVEYGIVSMALFITLILYLIRITLKNYKNNRGAFTSLLLFSIYNILTGVELNHKGVITGTIILFSLFALILLQNEEEKAR